MAKDSKIMADTEANISHCEKVDNLRGYLLDNLAVRKHMNYDWNDDD